MGIEFALRPDSTLTRATRFARPPDASHIPGAVNAEFFKSIQGLDPVKILRRAVFAFFGILNGTEYVLFFTSANVRRIGVSAYRRIGVSSYRRIVGCTPSLSRSLVRSFRYNPEFVDEVDRLTGGKKNADIVLYCNIGGQLEPWGSSEDGRQSRSLTAAYELYQNGYMKVRVLEGGVGGFVKQGGELERTE